MPNDTLRDIAEIRVDDRLRRPVQVRGSIPLARGAFAEVVKELLTKHSGELELGPDAGGLEVIQESDTPIGKVVRYRETRNGIPVFNTEILVAADTQGRVTQIDLSHHAKAAIADADGQPLSAKDALKRATDAVGSPKLRIKAPAPRQVYFPRGDSLVLAWLVDVPAADPAHDWEIVVDAHTGEVMHRRDLLTEIDGQGRTFDPNPVVTAGTNTLRDPSATPATCGFAGTPQATIDAQQVTRTLRDITLAGGQHTLDGSYARIVDFGGPTTTIPSEASATGFNYPSSDDRFDAVNVYYHVDTFQRYLQSLGIANANNRKIDLDPHDNATGGAFYSPLDKGLHFGDSGSCKPDRAEDGDCPIHEYGHAIQHNMVPTWGGTNPVTGREETGAVGEGYGDALACLYFSEAHGGFQREVFEDWCFAPGGLRRVDGTKVYPADRAAEVHADGEIWSAALWNAYRGMGGDSGTPATRIAARDAVIKTATLSNSLVPGNGTMPDAAEAVMRTDAALSDHLGRNCMAYLDSFHARGILHCDPAADLYIRDDSADPGVDAFVGSVFWDSPDLWVRNADDNGTVHQAPEFGQDNYFYTRVTNRGSATARAFVVTFNIKTFAGTQFVYPGDFLPPISAAVGFNLAPGASTVVKAKWPAAAVPAVGTHACWLAQVYMPTDTTAAGRHVWESNNLAQKNLAIVNLVPGDSDLVQLVVGNLAEVLHGLYRLEIRRPDRFPDLPVTIEHRDPRVIEHLFASGEAVPRQPIGTKVVRGPEVRFIDPGRVEVTHVSGPAVRLHLGSGSRVEVGTRIGDTGDRPLAAGERLAEVTGDRRKRDIAFFPGILTGLPIGLRPRSPISVGIRVQAPKDAEQGESFPVQVVQRNSDGQVVGGVTIQVNVT